MPDVRAFCRFCSVAALAVAAATSSLGQANLPLYTDNLVNSFQDWGWGNRNLADATQTHSGANSISFNDTAWNVAVSFEHPDFNASLYTNLTFWGHGGSVGGQKIRILAQYGSNTGPNDDATVLTANTWKQFTVPLSVLGVANVTNLNQITFQLTSEGTTNTCYFDDVQLTAKPGPAIVHLNVNTARTLRIVDSRWFAVNTAVWDSEFDTPTTVSLLQEMGARLLRFPGGSLSDEYHWASNTTGTNTWTWDTSFANFVHVATNIGAQAMITVNYGSGTTNEAANWVRSANVTNHYGFKYWEIGNECYGDWETDVNTNAPYHANDAWSYATRARDYIHQMKLADGSIKIGVVAVPGEDSYANTYSSLHPAVNPRTGQTHYGWTPILLTTLKSLGVTPDFLINHRYPEYSNAGDPDCADSDPLLLQSAGAWSGDASGLRQQISDYFGPSGTNIELLVTENNSDAGSPGRQSTSLVNGLYYADSFGQLAQTEFNSFIWWDLRNGADTTGSFDPTLYGWRNNGDLGMVGGLSTRYPPFYAAKLMQSFAQPGDTILSATSDYLLVSVYAARRASGAVSVLVLNQDATTNFNAQVALSGFTPASSATVRSFGVPQDQAAQTNGPATLCDLATNTFSGSAATFSYNFPALSTTLFTLAPTAPSLSVTGQGRPGGQLVLQIHGQPSVRYLLQSSADLRTWSNAATNTLTTTTLNLTNSIPLSPAARFWRVLWQP